MSKKIDERVVEMRFDNAQFESGAKTSISTLERLKQALNLKGASTGLENVSNAAKKVDLSGVGNAVESLRVKFSALDVMAATAFANMANSALNAGKRIASALFIEPPKDGLMEYETQINSTQTIMANTGEDVNTVNKALDELNEYADLTIYNFTEMTRNAGMFTAAGVKLPETMTALKGIGNWAAYAGANSSDMARATYQLGQALATGTIKLRDWMSIENTGGMAGKKYQEAFMETARAHGIAVDEIVEANGSFRESLSEGWLTSEIFIETMQRFANDQSMTDAATKIKTFSQLIDTVKEALGTGWATTWRTIIGDFEEAKELWTSVNDVVGGAINKMSDARNQMLSEWKDMGGRDMLIESFKNAFEGISSIIAPVKEAFSDIFPPMTAQRLLDFTEKLRNLTSNFKISESTANNLKSTFKGVFSLFDIGFKGISALAKGFGQFIGFVAPVGEGLLGITASIGEFITGINESIESMGIFDTIVNGITGVLSGASTIIGNIAKAISNAFKAITGGISGESILGNFSGIAEKIGEVLGKIREFITNGIKNLNFDKVLDFLNVGLLGGFLLVIKKIINKLSELGKGAGNFLAPIKEVLDGVKSSLEAWQSSLKADTLIKIAAAIGILAAALIALSFIDSGKLVSSLGAMGASFGELLAALAIFEKISPKGSLKGTAALIGLSTSVLILSSAMNNIAKLDWSGIAKGLTGMAGTMALLVAAANFMPSKGGFGSAVGMIGMATSLLILSHALEDLGEMGWSEIAKSLTAMSGALLALVTALNFIPEGIAGKAVGLIAVSTAMVILSSALGNMGGMSWGEIAKSLVEMSGALLALVTALNFIPEGIAGKAVGLVAVSTAMVILSSALSNMGEMSWGGIAKSMVELAGSLAILVAALNMIPEGIAGKALGLIGISSALVILSAALSNMGGMSWGEVAKSLVELAGSLTIIAAAMVFMEGALPGAAALIVVSASLAILTPVLMGLGSMSWEAIAKGLLALAGAFVVLGAAGLVLTPLAPGLLALGAAIALIGAGCLAAGVGVAALSVALTALGAAFTVNGAAITGAITSLLELIPELFAKLGEGVVAMATAIGNGSEALITAFTQIITALLTAASETVPQMVEVGIQIILALLTGINNNIGKVVGLGMQIIANLLQGIADHIGDVAESATNIITSFLDAIGNEIPRIVNAGMEMVVNLVNGIADAINSNSEALAGAMRNLAESMINAALTVFTGGLIHFGQAGSDSGAQYAAGLEGTSSQAGAAGTSVAQAGASGASGQGGSYNSVGSSLGGNLASGLSGTSSNASAAGSSVASAGASGASGQSGAYNAAGSGLGTNLSSGIQSQSGSASSAGAALAQAGASGASGQSGAFHSAGSSMASGLAQGIRSGISNAVSAAVNLAKSALNAAKNALGIHSPSRAFIELGNRIGEGLAQGIRDSAWQAVNESEEMSQRVIDVSAKSIDDIEDWIATEKHFDNLSSAEELEIWEAVIDKYAEGTEERLKAEKNAYTVYKTLRQEDFQNSKEWIDREKAYKRLSLEEEIEAWKRIQARYIEGTDEREEADRTIFDLENQLSRESFENSKNWIDREKSYNRLSLEEEIAAWERVQARYIKGTEEREEADKQVYELKHQLIDGNLGMLDAEIEKQKELISTIESGTIAYTEAEKELAHLESLRSDAAWENSKNWIEREKSYNRLDEQGEIDAWNRVLAAHWNESERREEAQLKIYELTHKQMEGDIDLIQKAIDANTITIANLQQGTVEYENAIKENAHLQSMLKDAQLENSENWISRRDDFGRERGLSEELAEAIRVQQRYVKGTKEREKWDKKVYDLEKEIYDAQQQYISDCADLETERETRRSELVEEYADNVRQINEQLEQDIKDLDDSYADSLESRAKALYNTYGLFDEVSKKDGIKASTLMRNLQDQVAYFEDWDDTINQLSSRGLNDALIEELQELGPSAYEELKALNSMSDSQLAQYANLWADKHREANDRATKELEDLRISTQSQISGLKEDAAAEIKELGTILAADLHDMNADIDSQLEDLRTSFQKEVGIIKTNTVDEFLKMDTAVKEILASAGYDEVGQQMISGLNSGIESGKPKFVEEIIGLGNEALNALKAVLGIQSPSKKFAQIGKYIGDGLTVGIEGCFGTISDVSEAMGTTSMDALRNNIGKISNIIDDSVDYTPTIRPVLDLSAINTGLGYMDNAFAANRSIRLGREVSLGFQNAVAPDMSEQISAAMAANITTNGKIADTIAGIKNDISDLVNKVGRLQVVMDTGRLVGEITPDMDRSLGTAAIMRRRSV